jgi:hypothetical protein
LSSDAGFQKIRPVVGATATAGAAGKTNVAAAAATDDAITAAIET